MKKLVFLLFLSSPSFAQSPFKVEAQLGSTLSNIIYDKKDFSNAYSIGLNVGATIGYSINEKIGLSTGLILQQRGTRMKAVSGLPSSRIILGYLSIPVLLSYHPIPKLSVSLGPELAVQVFRYGRSEGEASKLLSGYLKKTFDFGLQGGIGYQITEKIFVKSAYFYALTPLDEFIFTTNGMDQTLVKGYNRSFQLSIGYQIL